jgi:hypothetical protein
MQVITRNSRWIALTVAIMMVIALVIAAIPAGIARADSFPTIPNQFYGTVKNNGSLVSTGYTIVAKVGGTQVATTATNSSGQYGYDSAFYVATDDGNTIEFFVNGVQATETFAASAGSAVQVNLTVTGATATAAATTTTPATTTTTTTTTTTATGSTTTATSSSGDTNSNTVVSQPSQPAVVAQAPASQPVQSGNAQTQVNQQPAQQQQAPAKSSDSSLRMALIIVIGIAVTMMIIVIVLLVKRRQQY